MSKPQLVHYYKKAQFEQIKAFCLLVETKDLLKTAQLCASSAPSISLYMSSLEADLGFTLFVTKRNYELTDKGKVYYHKAKMIMKDVQEFYGDGQFNIKINKFDIYKFKLLKSIKSFIKFLVRKFKVFVRMFIKVKYLVLSILVVAFSVDLTLERYLVKGFEDKNNNLLKLIAKDIKDLDSSMSVMLKNAIKVVESEMLLNSNIKKGDLIKLNNILSSTTISVFNSNGKFYLTTGRALDKDYELYSYYTNLSVLDTNCNFEHKEHCKLEHEKWIEAKANPDTIIIAPIVLSLPRKIANKQVIIYSKKLTKFIDISINNYDIQDKILNSNINISDSLESITLLDNKRNIIASASKTNQSKNNINMQFDFNPDFNSNFYKNYKEHSYRIIASFSKSELNKEINTIRAVIFVITSFSLLLTYICWFVQKQPVCGRKRKGDLG